MSYRIRPGGSIKKNVRRIGEREPEKALAALADPGELGREESVHDVRRRAKKVRGLIRLARPALGGDYRHVNVAVRDAARGLGATRDAAALLATFDVLVGTTRAGGLDDVRAGLARRADDRRDDDAQMDRAASLLADALGRLRRVSPSDDVAPVLAGLEATYRRRRREFRRALREPDDAALHAWRKRAKYTWHHARLLQPLAPSVLRPMAKRFKDLSDGLGDDHDLALLRTALSEAPDEFGGPAAHETIVLIDGVRADLQDRCMRLGARLYAERPGAFATRIGRYWQSWDAVGRERPAGAIGDLATEPADRPPRSDSILAGPPG